VDVEVPAHKATPQVLWVYPLQTHQNSRGIHHSLSINLPVHLRYHKPSSTGRTHETISIEPSKILAKCDGK